ncbi:MAG: DUF86 domain-containing protein [Anaerolineales bacterium]|nr:DUF86 domain-containing protein [Anaerolineales bacterium]
MSRDYRLFLEDILECGMRIQSYAASLDFASFVSNQMAYDAILRNLEIIGEAAKNLPPEVRNRYPQVEWRAIAGLRDVMAHEYYGLENETLWNVVEREVPALVNQVKKILQQES